MKKTMAMLLSAAMVMSMGLMASAATQDYSVLVDGDKLTLTNGETRAVYQLDESRLVLSQSSEGGIAVSFSVEDEENKKVTLGSQKDVTVSGDLDRLNISQSLDKEYNIYLDKNADVRDLVSNGDARITVDGEVVEKTLRHTLSFPGSQFEWERDMALLHETYLVDDFYYPEMPVTRYVYEPRQVDTETFGAATFGV